MKIFTPEQLEHWSKLGPLQIQYHPHAEILCIETIGTRNEDGDIVGNTRIASMSPFLDLKYQDLAFAMVAGPELAMAVTERDKEIADLQQTIGLLKHKIDGLEAEIEMLEADYGDRGWII